MTDLDKAYIAGFFDGEGCFTVSRRTMKKRSGVHEYFTPVAMLVNTKPEVLETVAAEWGGNIFTVKRTENQKACFRLHLWNDAARKLILDLLPFLRIKKDVATLVANFPKRHGISLGRGKGARVDLDGLEKQKAIVQEIRALNKRGQH